MTESHVIVEHLVKTYPSAATPSVDDVGFALPRGEMLALLGPSGCGKTTILRMIAGLVEPTSGSIRLNGREISQIPVHRRNMGMVFQAYALFPHMTVAENIAFGLEMRNVPKSDRAAKVAQALDLVKLTGLGDRRITQLSGGQQQRCAIARSLVIEPELLLLDEPLSNLDAKLRDDMRDELAALHRRLGATFVYVTHDQVEAMTMSTRIALMDKGRIEQLGTPDDLYARPATLTVARFIGTPSINLLPAEIAPNGHVRALGCDLGLSVRPGAGPATLGLRAEDLSPAADGFAARVLRTETQGADRYVTCALNGDLRVTMRLPMATPLPDGPFRIGFDPARAHLFDADEQRMTVKTHLRVAA